MIGASWKEAKLVKRPGRPFLNVCGTLLAYFISSGKIQTDYSQLIAAFPPDDLLWFHSRDPGFAIAFTELFLGGQNIQRHSLRFAEFR